MKLSLYQRLKTINVCLLSLELKLNIKEGTANERTYLFKFVTFIKKNEGKKTVNLLMKKDA